MIIVMTMINMKINKIITIGLTITTKNKKVKDHDVYSMLHYNVDSSKRNGNPSGP